MLSSLMIPFELNYNIYATQPVRALRVAVPMQVDNSVIVTMPTNKPEGFSQTVS